MSDEKKRLQDIERQRLANIKRGNELKRLAKDKDKIKQVDFTRLKKSAIRVLREIAEGLGYKDNFLYHSFNKKRAYRIKIDRYYDTYVELLCGCGDAVQPDYRIRIDFHLNTKLAVTTGKYVPAIYDQSSYYESELFDNPTQLKQALIATLEYRKWIQ